MPSTISTPDSEVDIASAYVTGQNPQPVTLAAGADEDVNFTSRYQPTITVNLAGPLEPSGPGSEPGAPSAEGAIYDNDAVDGTTVTITPASGTGGSAVTCQVDGGYPGDNVDYGEPASCNVNVPPGTYSVSVPSTIQTPYSEVGIPVAFVSGTNPQTVDVQVETTRTSISPAPTSPPLPSTWPARWSPTVARPIAPPTNWYMTTTPSTAPRPRLARAGGVRSGPVVPTQRGLPGRQRRLRPTVVLHPGRNTWQLIASRCPRRSRLPIARWISPWPT